MQTKDGLGQDSGPRICLYAGVAIVIAALVALQATTRPVEAGTPLEQGYATARLDAPAAVTAP